MCWGVGGKRDNAPVSGCATSARFGRALKSAVGKRAHNIESECQQGKMLLHQQHSRSQLEGFCSPDLMNSFLHSHFKASRVEAAATCWKSCVAASRLGGGPTTTRGVQRVKRQGV